MENVIIFIIIAIIIIFNVINNYQKEVKKNKNRKIDTFEKKDISSQPTPFSRKTNPSTNQTETTSIFEKKEILASNITQKQILDNDYSQEGKSAIQNQIDKNEEREKMYSEAPLQTEAKIGLKFDSPDDLKKALISTLIFERKF